MTVGARVRVGVTVRVGVLVGLDNVTPAHITAGLSSFCGLAGEMSAKSLALSPVS